MRAMPLGVRGRWDKDELSIGHPLYGTFSDAVIRRIDEIIGRIDPQCGGFNRLKRWPWIVGSRRIQLVDDVVRIIARHHAVKGFVGIGFGGCAGGILGLKGERIGAPNVV